MSDDDIDRIRRRLRAEAGLPDDDPVQVVAVQFRPFVQFVATAFDGIGTASGFAMAMGATEKDLAATLRSYKRHMRFLLDKMPVH